MIHERSVLLGLLLATACSATTATAQSYRETKVANHFQVFAPPNNNAGTRYSVVVVTALAGTATDPCIVDLVDDGADGDTDDTQLNVSLTKGESLIRYIRDGAVNDDSGGVWDGDYFLVDATQPVSVYIATDSDWQHDWAPSDNGTLRGTRFFLYTNGYTVSRRDIDVFAYEDGTRVELYDVTASPLTSSGVTSLSPRPDNPLLSVDLDEGEDLVVRYGLGRDLLHAGHTYELVATAPVRWPPISFDLLDAGYPQLVLGLDDGAVGVIVSSPDGDADRAERFELAARSSAPLRLSNRSDRAPAELRLAAGSTDWVLGLPDVHASPIVRDGASVQFGEKLVGTVSGPLTFSNPSDPSEWIPAVSEAEPSSGGCTVAPGPTHWSGFIQSVGLALLMLVLRRRLSAARTS